ncbi:MAG TPA: hypothetical protein VN605_09175 [Thermoanaerobaculia bacterium]|nr:hypothetical protein [Thermoanaerobaculia bacterium]
MFFLAWPARAAVLSVGGSYPTTATLIPGRNTCGAVTVQDNLTTVVHAPAAATLSLSHAGNTYSGTIDETGRFATAPATLTSGSSRFTLTIEGRFTQSGMTATVQVDVAQSASPRNCTYFVGWTATKSGPPNTLPGAPELFGELPRPLPLFPRNNVWNIDVRDAPVDTSSAQRLAGIAAPSPRLSFAYAYSVVSSAQPLVPVLLDGGTTVERPVPDEAKNEAGWIGDGYLLIVDRDGRLLFELAGARWNAIAARWEAVSAAAFRLDANDTGLPVLPGVFRWDELAAPVGHALRVTMRGNTWPVGARLRLKANVELSGMLQPLTDAMKTFGLIVAGEGEEFAISATDDPRWKREEWNSALAALRPADFEVVELGWYPRQRVRARAVRH